MTTHTRPSNAPPWVQVVHRPSGRVVFTGRLDTARRVVGDDDRLSIRLPTGANTPPTPDAAHAPAEGDGGGIGG